MEVTRYDIEGLVSFVPRRFEDDRGLFFESFNHRQFEEMIGRSVEFVQDNESHSKKGVLRGLHMQAPPYAQGKLVRVISGSVIDVAVDLRPDSPSFSKHVAVELSADNGRIFWVPEGFAHGFVVLEEDTKFQYKCTNYYHKESELDLRWDDPELGIDWGVDNPILSDEDREACLLKDFVNPF